MECRKNFVDCLNELMENKLGVQNRLIELNRIQPALHKEIIPLNSIDTPKLFWQGSDVDLLELVSALYESGVIRSDRFQLRRKELLGAFESLFNLTIKDSAVKLSQAKGRKKEIAPFLERLKQCFLKDSESEGF